ncbi:Wzz/FepE/Etk N-terminal domain-containing protein [Thermus scotoductus]|uniref:Chain length determinant protein n=1 Tax=Thermus scotoductus (strain ATCC 700910 / SA-01) TaxID=743525 RepID=E8PKH1_THESS|nr:Wzz/FepE/Etk N-terminal domain-containing protein [Thermus scotoductus]ADW20943.1 chain length determinant protein [Thermus scotoductus SA-01]
MVEAPGEELSLRDILETLKRQRVWLLAPPVLFGVLALIYGFFIAEPRYASTATVNVAPVQVQAQLEGRIQVQGQSLLSFQALRAIAYSEEVTREVWETLRREGKLPTAWQDQGGTPGLERMVKDFKIKDETPRQQVVPQGQVPPVVASLTVQAPTPEVAARAANLWAEAVVKRVNAIPTARLRASLGALEEQIAPAEKVYREAQARWEAFQRTTTLAQDKAELDAKTGERVSLDQELSGLERDLAAVQGRIRALEAEARRQAALVPIGTSPEQLAIIGKRLKEAQENLKRETERARQAFQAAALTLENFRKTDRLSEWQQERDRLTQRLIEVGVRLAQVDTEKAGLEARIQDLEAALIKEPRVLELVREVVEDPVVAAALAKGDLSALAGLRLKTQEINPVYQPLVTQLVTLRANLAALLAEAKALAQEQQRLQVKLQDLRNQIAVQERAKEALLLEYNTKKAAYEAFRSRYDQIASLTSGDLSFDNPNPEYQRLRGTLIDAQAEEARLLARKAALEARIAQVEARINLLKERVARAQVEEEGVRQALELAKNAYLALSQKRTDLQIELASSQNSLAQLIAPAYPIYEKVAPKRGLILALAFSLGLGLGVMAAFVAEALRPPRAEAAG